MRLAKQCVQVRIFNASAKTLHISSKFTLCELQEVKLLRRIDLKKSAKGQSASINSQLP